MSAYRKAADRPSSLPASPTRVSSALPWLVLLASAPNALALLAGEGHGARLDALALLAFAGAGWSLVASALR